MDIGAVLAEAFGRIQENVTQVASGLTAEQLAWQPGPGANSAGWLLWHLTRVQDDHVSEAAGVAQAYVADGWAQRLGLAPDDSDTGYGHQPEQVTAVRISSADQLIGYHDAVSERTIRYVRGLTAADLDRVVDSQWDPPVTLGVRLVSVFDDDMQHAGQAAYLRGLIEAG